MLYLPGARGDVSARQAKGGRANDADISSLFPICVRAVCCAAAARGGEFPERPVQLIIPFPPGGASDFGGRLVAAGLTDILGQPFVVDNRGGASGLTATEIAVRSQPDGYTLFLGNVNTMAIHPYIQQISAGHREPFANSITPSALFTLPVRYPLR